MIWLLPLFIVFCIFIAKAPRELTRTLLAGVWAVMALWAVGATMYAIGSVVFR